MIHASAAAPRPGVSRPGLGSHLFRAGQAGHPRSTMTACLELTLPAAPASARRARVAVGDALQRLGASGRLVDDVRLCVSEAVSNVIRHAYSRSRRGDVELLVELEADEVNVVVRDTGVGLGARSRPARSGGYGLQIIGRIASRCTIASTTGAGTEVRMTFSLAGQE